MTKQNKHAPKRIKTPRYKAKPVPSANEWDDDEGLVIILPRTLRAAHATADAVWVTRY